MKGTERLSLADFAADGNTIATSEALESIQGGGLFNCHGKSGQIGKKIRDVAIEEGVKQLIKKNLLIPYHGFEVNGSMNYFR